MQEEIKEKLKEAGETVEEPQNQELGKCLEGFIKEYHRSIRILENGFFRDYFRLVFLK